MSCDKDAVAINPFGAVSALMSVAGRMNMDRWRRAALLASLITCLIWLAPSPLVGHFLKGRRDCARAEGRGSIAAIVAMTSCVGITVAGQTATTSVMPGEIVIAYAVLLSSKNDPQCNRRPTQMYGVAKLNGRRHAM